VGRIGADLSFVGTTAIVGPFPEASGGGFTPKLVHFFHFLKLFLYCKKLLALFNVQQTDQMSQGGSRKTGPTPLEMEIA
jgi:hypothetical protein